MIVATVEDCVAVTENGARFIRCRLVYHDGGGAELYRESVNVNADVYATRPEFEAELGRAIDATKARLADQDAMAADMRGATF